MRKVKSRICALALCVIMGTATILQSSTVFATQTDDSVVTVLNEEASALEAPSVEAATQPIETPTEQPATDAVPVSLDNPEQAPAETQPALEVTPEAQEQPALEAQTAQDGASAQAQPVAEGEASKSSLETQMEQYLSENDDEAEDAKAASALSRQRTFFSKPSLTYSNKSPSTWTNGNVILEYKVSKGSFNIYKVYENGSRVFCGSSSSYTGRKTFTSNGTLSLKVKDRLCQYSYFTLTVDNIDRVAPTITNMPSGNVSPASFDAVVFADKGDPGWGASGINASTRKLMIYTSKNAATPLYTWNWDDIAANWNLLTGGTYYINASVADNATNVGYAFRNPSDMKEIIVQSAQPSDLAISATKNPTDWTNQAVTVVVTATSTNHAITSVERDGTARPITNPNLFTETITFNNNGTTTYVAKDVKATQTQQIVVDNIDRVAPTITGLPNSGTITSALLHAVNFNDAGEVGYGASGINASTQTLYVFSSNAAGATPIHTLPWATAGATLDTLATGTYYLDASVVDNAGNKTFANGGTTSTPGGGVEIVNGTSDIDINETGRSHTTWTNGANVTVDFEVVSALNLDSVKVDGTTVYTHSGAGQTTYTGTITFVQNGTKTIEAKDRNGHVVTEYVTVSIIDRVKPLVANLPNSGIIDASSFSGVTFNDQGEVGYQASGVDNTTRTLYIFNSSSAAAPAYTWDWADIVTNWATLPAGTYYLDASVKDNAGNIGFANGGTGARPGGGGGVEVEPSTSSIDIIETNRNYSTFTSRTVIVSYDVISSHNITEVRRDGTLVYGGGAKNYSGQIQFVKNGSVVLTAKNSQGETKQITITVDYIDKVLPTIANMPSGKVTTDDIRAIVFDDPSAPDYAVSGINQATRRIYVYDSPVATVEKYKISYDNLDLLWKHIPAGIYYLDASVFDNAGNLTYANGRCGMPGLPVEINVLSQGLDITETGRSTTDFTVRQVSVSFEVSSASDIIEVKRDNYLLYRLNGGTPITSFTNTMYYGTNGDYTITSTNRAGETKTKTFTVNNIDKENPTIQGMPTSGNVTVAMLEAVVFSDPATSNYASSGINEATRRLYVYDSATATKEKYKFTWDQIATQLPKLPAGTYYLDASVFDNVGNLAYANGTVGRPGPAITIN